MIKSTVSRLLTIGVFKPGRVLKFIFLILLVLIPWGVILADEASFTINPWPDGMVRYRFDDGTLGPKAVTPLHQSNVRDEMDRWETAMAVADPLTGVTRKYIQFVECTSCTKDVVVIRYNDPNHPHESDSNICTIGTIPGGEATLRMNEEVFGDCKSCPNTIRHELGHCLGVWHEFNRADADRWLEETPDEDGEGFEEEFSNTRERSALMPIIGNYDYDSLMHYSMLPGDHIPTFKDETDPGNSFGRQNLDASGMYISARDKSRLLQYYAWAQNRNWGFFKSLSSVPSNPDSRPNPHLAKGVEAIGSPAIAAQSPGNYDIFARGSDNHLYWKEWRLVNGIPSTFPGWRSIGCCFSSDPSAVSRSLGRVDVAVVNDAGEVQRIKYIDGRWYAPLTLRGGYPTGGIKQDGDGNYIGPAIASRDADLLDVFVVRKDGRLSVTTWRASNWWAWRTLGKGYNVTARPAAVALSATQVQLAINESDVNLYEPFLTFPPLAPSFSIGTLKGTTATRTPPALTKRDSKSNPYRVLITNADGRIAHRFATGSWRDIGGIPKPGTGPSAVATGPFGAYIVMNGEDATGCDAACAPDDQKSNGQVIQPGGLWLRHFE